MIFKVLFFKICILQKNKLNVKNSEIFIYFHNRINKERRKKKSPERCLKLEKVEESYKYEDKVKHNCVLLLGQFVCSIYSVIKTKRVCLFCLFKHNHQSVIFANDKYPDID